MRELGFISGWIFFIALKIAVDYLQIVKLKRSPAHWFEFIVMMAIGLGWMRLSGGVNELGELPYALELLAFQAGSFWLLFDGFLNLTLDRNFFQYGSTAVIDKFFKRAGMGPYVMTKLMALILMVCGIIWIYSDLHYHI